MMMKPDLSLQEILNIKNDAELLYSANDVEQAIEKLAGEISEVLENENPIVISLMLGAIIFTGKLLPLLNFPLQLQYIHATRYQDNTCGGEIIWKQDPELDLDGRTILIVDDILDEGITLAAVVKKCVDANAKKVYSAVLVDKQIDKPKKIQRADFTGLSVPDHYVFGYGMDYKGYLRNAPGIFAVKKT